MTEMSDEEAREWQEFWDSLPSEQAEIVADADALRKAGIDPEKYKECRVVGNADHPSYYGGDECIEAMVRTQGIEAVKNFCICCAFKYLWRWRRKGGVDDIKKAIWYLQEYLNLEAGK